MTSPLSRARRAGMLVPLFSMPSTRSWGIGEIGDLDAMTAWLERAGQRALLMLPINEMPLHESSPYSALSAMAIDPQFITLDLVEDFAAIGGEAIARARAARAPGLGAIEPCHRLRLGARAQARRAAAVLRTLSADGVEGRLASGGAVPRLHRGAGVVAGRLRALSRVARALRRAGMDGVAGTNPEPASRGHGRRESRAGRGRSVPQSTSNGLLASNGRPRGRAPGASPCSAISHLS